MPPATANGSTRSSLRAPAATPQPSSAAPARGSGPAAAPRRAVPLVARGDAAPGGGSFEFLGSRPVLNDSGVVAFVAIVRLPAGRRSNETTGVFTVDRSRRVSALLPPQPVARRVSRAFLRR